MRPSVCLECGDDVKFVDLAWTHVSVDTDHKPTPIDKADHDELVKSLGAAAMKRMRDRIAARRTTSG
jgi:hypothetical protein